MNRLLDGMLAAGAVVALLLCLAIAASVREPHGYTNTITQHHVGQP